jgi:hypothetical protein
LFFQFVQLGAEFKLRQDIVGINENHPNHKGERENEVKVLGVFEVLFHGRSFSGQTNIEIAAYKSPNQSHFLQTVA